MTDKSPLILTRFMQKPALENFLRLGEDAIPSLAITKYNPESYSKAYNFGSFGLLANPDEMNPRKNDIYLHDHYTPNSPRLFPFISDEGADNIRDEFGMKDVSPKRVMELMSRTGFGALPERLRDDLRAGMEKWAETNTKPEERIPASKIRPDWNAAADKYRDALENALYRNSAGSFYLDKSGEITPADEINLPKDIRKTTDQPFWMRQIPNWNPLQTDYDEMLANLNKRLSYAKKDMRSPVRAETEITKAFNSEFPETMGLNGQYIHTGRVPRWTKEGKQEFKNRLQGMNKRLAGQESELPSPAYEKAADYLGRMKSDFAELKKSGSMTPQSYLGMIYPDEESRVWEYTKPEQRKRIIGDIKDTYGDKAIPYRAIVDREDSGLDTITPQSDERVKALGELMKKAGI